MRSRLMFRANRQTHGEPGFTIGMLLMVISLAVIFAFALASTAIIHLHLTSREYARHQADNLADSALANAVCQLMGNAKYGLANSMVENVTIVPTIPPGTNPAPPGSGGFLTFMQGQTQPGLGSFGMPYSTNNYANLNGISGWNNTKIPDHAVALFAVGIWGDTIRTREAIVYAPPFPDCVAVAGSVTSNGPLTLSGVTTITDIHNPGVLSPSNLAPGDLAANATGASAIQLLDPATHITGDVKSCGTVTIAPGSTIGGAVYENGDPIVLPWLDIEGKILQATQASSGPSAIQVFGGGNNVPSGFYQGGWTGTGTGNNGSAYDVTVNGDLVLNDTVLVIGGGNPGGPTQPANLTVTGGVQGTGCILCTGKLEIDNASDLASQNSIALASIGDMTLKGSSASSSYFAGLAYTRGNFNADKITLMGAVVANPNGPEYDPYSLTPAGFNQPPGKPAPPNSGGNAVLSDVQVVNIPGIVNFQIVMWSGGNNGAPTMQFTKSSAGFLGSGLGSTARGYVQPQSGSINMTVSVTVSPPPPGSNTPLYTFNGPSGQTTDINVEIQNIKSWVKSKQPSTWFGGPVFNSGAFDKGIPAMLRRLMDVALLQYKAEQGQPTKSLNDFFVDPNEFLNPADQMRIEIWTPVAYPY